MLRIAKENGLIETISHVGLEQDVVKKMYLHQALLPYFKMYSEEYAPSQSSGFISGQEKFHLL